MHRTSLIVLALCTVLIAVAQAGTPGPAAPAPSTVGDFAVKVANALGYEAPSPEAAAEVLRNRGVDLTVNLGAALTEGDAALILDGVGVPVVPPGNPGQSVSSSKATALASFASGMATHSVGQEDGDFNIGQIAMCLHSATTGACVTCCEAIIPGRTGRLICPLLCKFNHPPSPSASVPGS